MAKRSEIPYGPIIVVKGEHAGRIGIYEDDEGRSEMIVYLYGGTRAPTTLAFITDAESVILRASQVRVPTADEGAAILTLVQAEYSGIELVRLARGGLKALEVAGVDAGMSRLAADTEELGIPSWDKSDDVPF